MKNLIITAVFSACAFAMTGCMTERTSYVVEGETAEAVAGFSEDDIRTVVLKVIQDINIKSARYSTPQNPVRVVNVKKVKIDTNSRGNDAVYLADTIAQCFKEELGGRDPLNPKFYVYNEEVAAKLVNVATSIEFWQKRVPLRKAVDKSRAMY